MRKAFTIIEILIALVLMTVVLYLTGLAIDTHLRLMESSRTEVEESQLGRALLEKVARDIRSVTVAKKEENLAVDTSIFASMFDSSLLGGADTSALLGDESSTGSESTETTNEITDIPPEEGTVVGSMPGIYGSVNWIQIDTGRLPRGETFKTQWVLAEGTSLGDRVSPTKTALYYIGDDTGMMSEEDSTEERLSGSLGQSYDRFAVKYGLYRRLLDRYVTEYATENELEAKYETYDEALAPEVESIEFYYYDTENEEWIDYWDMDEMGSLPGAVRVILEIRKKARQQSAMRGIFGSPRQEINTLVFSTVVPMPLSYVAPVAEEEEETTDTGTSTDSESAAP